MDRYQLYTNAQSTVAANYDGGLISFKHMQEFNFYFQLLLQMCLCAHRAINHFLLSIATISTYGVSKYNSKSFLPTPGSIFDKFRFSGQRAPYTGLMF